MNCLEIADSFEPYYEGRSPFACTNGRNPADATKALSGNGRFASDTNDAAVPPPCREPAPRRPGG